MNEMTGITDTETALPATLPELALDVENYRAEVDQFDMTEQQKRDLLETLWSIMRLFVELGFSVDVSGQVLRHLFTQAAGETKDGEK